MRPLTHILFSGNFCLLFATFASIVLKPIEFVAIALSSTIPDIDDKNSLIGKVFYPVSNRIERTFGKRTITHSLAGLGIVAFILSPLLFFKAGVLYSMILLSILAHAIIDCVNKEGVNLFYPSLVRAVLPKNDKYRIEEGSKSEKIFSYVLIGILLVLFPLNRVGLKPALHFIIRTPQEAVQDYIAFSGQSYKVLADFEGVKNISQEKIKGAWEVVDLASKNSLLVKDDAGRLYSIGNEIHDNIRPTRIRSMKGEVENQSTQKLTLKNILVNDILDFIPEGKESFISGYLLTDEAFFKKRTNDIDTYQTVKILNNRIELSSATIKDLIAYNLLKTFVIEGQIIIRTIYPKTDQGDIPRDRETYLNPNKILFVHLKGIKDIDDILVREGDSVGKGEVIAIRKEDRSLKLIEIEKEKIGLALARSELRIATSKAYSSLKLKKREDDILGMRRELKGLKERYREEIRRASSKVYSVKRNIGRLYKAIKDLETRSPSSGEVVSIRHRNEDWMIRIMRDKEQLKH